MAIFLGGLGLKILMLVSQLQSGLIIYKTYCLEFLRICSPGLRGGIHASQSSTLWSYGSHCREFFEDKSILSLFSNLLFSSSFNTLNGNGIEGVDFIFLFYFFKFYFIFKLYIIVLVLPNIKMNPPQVYMCSPS